MKTPEEMLSRGEGRFVNCTDYDDAIKAMKEYAKQEVAKVISSNPPVMLSLPSDEKINVEALATEGEYRNSEWKRGYKIGFMNCAKWMKEQIEKLNK